MLLSNLVTKHKTPPPRFAPGLFLVLLAVFMILGQSKPVYGLAGIGATVLIAGALVELNRDRIWDDYKKTYKKQKGLAGMWTKPTMFYYNVNVYFLWPFVIFMGLVCLWAAYLMS